jgi:surfactin synthase thioesterase subunit
LLAFEATRQLARNRHALPEHLFVSGANAPQYRSPSRNFHLLPDDALIQSLRNYNGTPAEILDNRDLMELLLPTIRADFALAEGYQYQPGPLLTLPITVFAGKKDDHISMDDVEGWREETMGRCEIRWFEGDHFFIDTERQAVLDCILGTLRS